MAFHKLIRALLTKGEFPLYGDGKQTRDFSYISDVVEANLLAMEAPCEGKSFNIGGGNPISMGEVLSLLENLSGKKLRIRWEEEQKGDVQDTYADISKARRLLGYAPKIKLAEGLEKEIAWMKGEL
tara:strand:+ start:371 stop:748 length:378 start_codon:yes stop_codon:yes gene_type:complete